MLLALFHPCFQPGQIGFHDCLVTLEREDQGDVDIQSGGDAFPHGRDTFFCSRDLDHQVGAIHLGPQLFCLSHRPACVMRQVRIDLQADITITTPGGLIERQEQVRRPADILDCQPEEDALRLPAGPGHRLQCGIVIR